MRPEMLQKSPLLGGGGSPSVVQEKEWMRNAERGSHRSFGRAASRYLILLAAALSFAGCFALLASFRRSDTTVAMSRAEQGAHHLSPIVVGPRKLAPQYHGRGCDSAELLRSLKSTHIRPDGASRTVNSTLPNTRLDLKDGHFDFSFDLKGCPTPHLYSAEEACDLLKGFGGVFLRGDSFVRHVVNALFMILSERTDGAVDSEGKRCRGNAMFDDRKAHCREHSITDSQALVQKVCGNEAFIYFDMQAWGAQPDHLSLSMYYNWLGFRPMYKKMLSPVFIAGFGLHNQLDASTAILGFIRPFIATALTAFPRPLGLWQAIHAPAPGKPAAWAEKQDSHHVLQYNKIVAEALDALAPPKAGLVGEKILTEVSWYGATDGAESYDGSHYSEQVNMEKALILLNLLDVAWGEAKEAGGLIHTY